MADTTVGVGDPSGRIIVESYELKDASSIERDPSRLTGTSTPTDPHASNPETQNGPCPPRSSSPLAFVRFKRYKCCVCGQSFAISRVLETHKMIEHKMEATRKCAECGMQFLHARSYIQHMSERHNTSPYKCEICSQGFATKHKFNAHKSTHSTRGEKRTYKCEFCPAEYPHPCKLRYHMRFHTGEKPFKCNFCHLAFPTSSHRLGHIQSAHCRVREHLCDHCGRKFSRQRELKDHYRTHTGERPYVCAVCSRAFTKRSALVVHTRQHTGEKPYVCDQCGQAFTVRVSLRTHLKNKHNLPDICVTSSNSIRPIGRPKRLPQKDTSAEHSLDLLDFDSAAEFKQSFSE